MPTTAIPSRGPPSGSCSLISCFLLRISPSGLPLLARAPPPQLLGRLSLAVEGPSPHAGRDRGRGRGRGGARVGRDRRRGRPAAPGFQRLGETADGRVAEH